MGTVCPSCDEEPPADVTAGGACVACGSRLILVDTRDPLIGSVVNDRFEVLGLLGRGGMGVVYRARQSSIGREVALKVLDPQIAHDVASVKRFVREAQLASRLAHPNTVGIIDFGQSQAGHLYIVMELVRGHDLAEEIAQHGALPVERVAAIGIQLCDPLEVAHALEIIHRDLKPENVMLMDGARDHIKILDFGLARALTDPNTRATATGLISGTPRYMSPEVAFEGAEPAPAQDMYAVGVILAELALGRALWTAPTIPSLFTLKLDLDATLADVPSPLRELLRPLLSASPGARPTAHQLGERLRQLQEVKAPPERAPEPRAADFVFPELDQVSLVDLDGRSRDLDAAPPSTAPTMQLAELASVAPAVAPADLPPAPPLAEPPRAREGSQTAPTPPPPPRPHTAARSGPRRGTIAAIALVVAVLGGAALYLANHAPAEKASNAVVPARGPRPASSISLEILAAPGATVTVDGYLAGNAPTTVYVRRGTAPIEVTATLEGVIQTQRIVPDRDQTLNLTSD